MRRHWLGVLAVLGIAGATAGCFPRHRPAWDDAMRDSLSPEARQVADSLAATLQPGMLGAMQGTVVGEWKGPGGRTFEVAGRTSQREAGHSRPFGTITLQTSLRSRPVGQYPCTSCHLGRKIVMADRRIAHAHEDVQPVHPRQTGAVCSTCHAADNVEFLPLKEGGRAPLDQSYRLCAQCHFQQVEAWAAGAHGKRLDGWEGRRVVMGCGDCHDPHKPAIEPRIPFRAPELERSREGVNER